MRDNPDYKMISVDKLIPYNGNSRTHSDSQITQLASSIREFGFTNPILTDADNGIIAGHGRLMAAKKLGMKEVPCLELSHLTAAQRKAYVIADNKLALNAGWDYDALRSQMEEIIDLGLPASITGFDDVEISDLFGEDAEGDAPLAESEEVEHVYEVSVECRDEAEQESVYKMMTERGLKCRILSI